MEVRSEQVALENEIIELKKQLIAKEVELMRLNSSPSNLSKNSEATKLINQDIARFSRQIIMPEIGMSGQLSLKRSSVLIVGAGGLGCPAALYLGGAGVGHIGIVDYDEVETSNLHRQLLHTEASIGIPKVQSAAIALRNLNKLLDVTPYHIQLDSKNALEIIKDYDVVLDATDNVATRYLLNDACVLTGRPLVSGSALKFEGQLTVYNYENGPCYRCIFPTPPPPETVTNCGDGGVLGVVPGVIGTLQALEAIKIVTRAGGVLSQRWLVFDGADSSFRNVKLRPRRAGCAACGDTPTIAPLTDYEVFCGSKANDKDSSVALLSPADRISVVEYQRVAESQTPHLLVDVRSEMEFTICRLPGAINVPMETVDKDVNASYVTERLAKERREGKTYPVFVVCRRGNDSQKAVVKLRSSLSGLDVAVKDLAGGLHAWTRTVDPDFPIY